MSKSKIQLVLILLLIGLVVLFKTGKRVGDAFSKKVASPAISAPPPAAVPDAPEPRLPAEDILKNYGDPKRPPQDDLMWMARALDNYSLLVKGDQPLPTGANEEIAKALLGKNRAHMKFISEKHSALNSAGQIIDRWGSALFFHSSYSDRLDIRSAGPDKQMWTEDDLHRRYDGTYLKGEALLAPSLFDATLRPRSP